MKTEINWAIEHWYIFAIIIWLLFVLFIWAFIHGASDKRKVGFWIWLTCRHDKDTALLSNGKIFKCNTCGLVQKL